MMLVQYFPTGLLGLGLTALMASFMSGMAGNVTAFNTVWTYDIYQSYIAPKRSDTHYLWMGRMATVFGILVSIGTAYVAAQFNNIMEFIQLVFGFVNGRCLPHSCWACSGSGRPGTARSSASWPATARRPAYRFDRSYRPLDRGRQTRTYGSEMAQNFWMAIYSWTTCFAVTIAISLLTERKKTDDELRGLVYSLTDRFSGDDHLRWFAKPEALAVIMVVITIVLNIIFW